MDDKDIVGAALLDGTVLDKDDIPNKNQSLDCFSCGAKMTGIHCAKCGQRNDDYRRSIFKLVGELIGNLTALESRIWRTWGALLFKPGKVAREFADGARVKWSTPIRAFLAISILMFGFLSITKTQLISIDINVVPKDGISKPHKDLTKKDLRIKGAARFFEAQSKIDERNKTRNFDLIDMWLADGTGLYFDIDGNQVTADVNEIVDTSLNNIPDSADIDKEKIRSGFRDVQEQLGEAKQEVIDALPNALKPKKQVPPEENTSAQDNSQNTEIANIEKPAKVKSPEELVIQTQWKNMFVRVVRNPGLVNNIIYKWLPRVMFLMMPLTMFIGVVFIRGRKNALLYDHLVHAAYIHAVAFFLVFLGILLMYILPGTRVAQALLIVMLIYLPLSLKRMFRRGWIKTIWTSYGVGLIYSLTLMMILSSVIGYQITKLASQFS